MGQTILFKRFLASIFMFGALLGAVNAQNDVCSEISVEGVQIVELHNELTLVVNLNHSFEGNVTVDVIVDQFDVVKVLNTPQDYELPNPILSPSQVYFPIEPVDHIIGIPDDLEINGFVTINFNDEMLTCTYEFNNATIIEDTNTPAPINLDINCENIQIEAFLIEDENGLLVLSFDVTNHDNSTIELDDDQITVSVPSNYSGSINIPNATEIDLHNNASDEVNLTLSDITLHDMDDHETVTLFINIGDCSIPAVIDVSSESVVTGDGVIIVDDFWQVRPVYPNPSKGRVVIEQEGQKDQQTKVVVYNLIGKSVRSEIVHGATTELNLNDLERGVYIIELTNGQQVITQRLIKE